MCLVSERDRAGTVKGRGKESGLQGRGVRELAALAEGERVRFPGEGERESHAFRRKRRVSALEEGKGKTQIQEARTRQTFRGV